MTISFVRYKLNFAEIEQGRPATVKDAAVAFKEICYEYRLINHDLSFYVLDKFPPRK